MATQRWPDRLSFLARAERPRFRASSPHLAGLIGQPVEGGIIDPATGYKVRGAPIGYYGENRTGGVCCYDAFELWRKKKVKAYNALWVGDSGYWKTSSVKFLATALVALDYNVAVTDVKGEYGIMEPLIPGFRRLVFGRRATTYINPLDPIFDELTMRELIRQMAIVCIGGGRKHLSTLEDSILTYAIVAVQAEALAKGRDPILPDLVDRLRRGPTDEMVDKIKGPFEAEVNEIEDEARERRKRAAAEIREASADLTLGLQKMTDQDGDYFGMFHRETSEGLFDECRFLVFDCSDLQGTGNLELLAVILINFFLPMLNRSGKSRLHYVFHDENWRFAKHREFGESLQSDMKLGGSDGTSHNVILHSLEDFNIHENADILGTVVQMTEIKFIFAQTTKILKATADLLQVSRAEARFINEQDPGHCLLKLGNQRGIPVEFDPWPEVKKFVESRGRALGRSEQFGAV